MDKPQSVAVLTKVRAALLILAVGVGLVFVWGTGQARAATVNWQCTVGPTTWCLWNVGHFYDVNRASRPAPWNMCQKLVAPNSNPEYQYTIGCANNVYTVGGRSNDLGRAPYPNNNTVMHALIANNSSRSNATIFGDSVY